MIHYATWTGVQQAKFVFFAQRRAKILNTRKQIILSVLGWILAIAPAHAWYDFGHMEVASIAYKRLNAQTKARVSQLLKLNPYYSQWTQNLPVNADDDTKELYIFAQCATWPDAIKSDETYKPDGADKGYSPIEPIASQNIGYEDHYLHKYWHFTDHPFSTDGTTLPPPQTVNAQTQIAAFRKALASTDVNDDVKSYDLTWLVHLVGDVHQPLHCAMRVSKSDTNGDAGGNDVKLACPDCPANLHSFWDGAPGSERSVPLALQSAAELRPAKQKQVKIVDESVWVDESFKLAKQVAYSGPIKSDDGPFELSESYKRKVVKLANERVALAGERLAAVLNQELK